MNKNAKSILTKFSKLNVDLISSLINEGPWVQRRIQSLRSVHLHVSSTKFVVQEYKSCLRNYV